MCSTLGTPFTDLGVHLMLHLVVILRLVVWLVLSRVHLCIDDGRDFLFGCF